MHHNNFAPGQLNCKSAILRKQLLKDAALATFSVCSGTLAGCGGEVALKTLYHSRSIMMEPIFKGLCS